MRFLNSIKNILLWISLSIITCQAYANVQTTSSEACNIAKFQQYQIEYCLKMNEGPLLVFESGQGNSMESWPASFLEKLQKNHSILIYNRVGYGKSLYYTHNVNQIVTAKSVSEHLLALLNKLAINQKKILVAHSIGGIYAQYFIKTYPNVFSGLVLIDASSQFEPIKDSPFQSKLKPKMGTLPYYEYMGFNTSVRQTDKAPSFPNIPLLVISATNHRSPEHVEKLWQEIQRKIVKQSKFGSQIIAEGSGHYVFIDQPALVINAINKFRNTFLTDSFQGSISTVPVTIQKLMKKYSWQANCPVPLNDLVYLKLSYWGFDNKAHIGDMIVHKTLATETVAIFKQLFQVKYPIERMEIAATLRSQGSSEQAVNDTVAFRCDRDGTRSSQFSMHAYGIAIDLNPAYNPALVNPKLVTGGIVPRASKKYLNRELQHPAMIHAGDAAFMIFTQHGWEWGGFSSQVDYMHFRKVITQHYRVDHMNYIAAKDRIPNLPDF